MKNGIDQRYVAQVGSILQHKLACQLAEDAGYITLRSMLSDFFQLPPTQVYKQSLKIIDIPKAAEIINALRLGKLPPQPKGHRIKRASE